MGYQFTTIEECQEKINTMKKYIYDLRQVSSIQFPIVFNNEPQFEHYELHHISYCIDELEYHIEELQDSLNKYKKEVKEYGKEKRNASS